MKRHSVKIVEELVREIQQGGLADGDRFPTEGKLCERFKVSRTVIREAIQQLQARGYLRSRRGSGTYVTIPGLQALQSAMEAFSSMAGDGDFLELIDFRILVESECARLAADNAGEHLLHELRDVLGRMKMAGASGDRDAYSREDIAFHLLIARASGNRVYATVLGALEKRCIAYAQTNRGDDNWYAAVTEEHTHILDAIELGHAEQAAETMRRHLLSSRRHYVDL